MPQFLEIILSFGAFQHRAVPIAYQNAVFRYEHGIDSGDAVRSNIPELGRSGRVIQNCYNLWSVEYSDDTTAKPPWAIRQTGVYHSFDVGNGRALWITVKANTIMEDRVKKATTRGVSSLGPKALENVADSFKASLATHLITLEWCCEGWQHCIAYWETDLEKSLSKIKFAPMAELEAAMNEVKSIVSSPIEPFRVQYAPSSGTTFAVNSRSGTWATTSGSIPNRRGTGLTSLTTKLEKIPDSECLRSKAALTFNAAVSSPTPNPLEKLDFKLEDMQHLHYIGTKLQEVSMVMRLNIDIVMAIMEYYRTYLEDLQIPESIRVGSRGALLGFLQRTASIVRELETERGRISTLLVMAEDCKVLVWISPRPYHLCVRTNVENCSWTPLSNSRIWS
jgi:hypothetical protein